MIGRLSGTLVEKNPPRIVVDVGGVGYELDVSMTTFYNLPKTGEKVVLFTHLVVREDAHLLYGFGTENERKTFRELLKVNGVGPKVALAVLSGLSVDDLSQAVALGETGRLTKIPGIGKKTAERLLLELKGKLAPALAVSAAASHASADILAALVSLGYNEREALVAMKALPAEVSVADGIRAALKTLAKA